MIWLTWRQHRIEMLILGILFALVAAYLIYQGLIIGAGYNQVVHGMSAATCAAQQNPSALCQTLQSNFYDTYEDPNLDLLIPLILPALGVTAGTLLRNTVPAMLVTLVGYTAVRVLIGQVVRPIYLPPISATWDPYLTAPQVIYGSNDWITTTSWVDHAGNFVSNNQVGQVCGVLRG